jgi:hypothetical protein
MQHLPVELIEAMIGQSLHDNPTSAKSISLICRRFQYIGQETAFRRLKILIPTHNNTSPFLSKLHGLVDHPLLLSHVTEIDLEVLGNDEACIPWMNQHVALLQHVLDLASQQGKPLQGLSLAAQWGFRDWMTSHHEEQPKGSEFRERLYEMMSIPTIQSLDIIGLPSRILRRHLPALKHLTTRGLIRSSRPCLRKPIAGLDSATQVIPLTPAVLDTLRIQSSSSCGNAWDAFDYLASAYNTNILLHSLTSLNMLCWHNESWDCARRILDKCRSSLEVLTIKWYNDSTFSFIPFSLSLSLPR